MPSFHRVFSCCASAAYGLILLNLGFVAALPFVMELAPDHVQRYVLWGVFLVDCWPYVLATLLCAWLLPAAPPSVGIALLVSIPLGWLAVPCLVATLRRPA